MADKFMIDFSYYYDDLISYLYDIGRITFEASEKYLNIIKKSDDEEAANLIEELLIKHEISYKRHK